MRNCPGVSVHLAGPDRRSRSPVHLAGPDRRYIWLVHLAGTSGWSRSPVQIAGTSGWYIWLVQIGTALSSISFQFVGYLGTRSTARDPNCAGLGSRAGRFKPRGGVRGALVSLNEKARAMAGLIVVPVVLGIKRALVGLIPQGRARAPLDRYQGYGR